MTVTINGSTGIVNVAGSATTPAESSGAGNTGLYFPTTTSVAITTNGTQAILVDSSQNVGIGTASPASFGANITTVDIKGSAGSGVKMGTAENLAVYYYAGNAYVSTLDSSPMIFQTNNSERMRIDTGGNLLIGTSTTFAKLSVVTNGNTTSVFKNAASGGYSREAYVSSNSGTYYFDFFGRYDTSANLGSISSNGTLMTYATSSDVRLKDNIVDAPTALPALDSLKVRSFDWKTGPHQKFGFIAQELNEVDPNAVAKGPTEDYMWGIDTSVLVPMLTKALQEAIAKINTLETEVAALKIKVGA